jgi:glutaredoxin
MKALLAILLLCTSLHAGADVFKWTDKQGVVHYGDKPPEQTGKNSAADTAAELSPVQILSDGKVVNPQRNTVQLAKLFDDTEKPAPDNLQGYAETATRILEQLKQIISSALENTMAQVAAWRNTTPVISNDTINTISTNTNTTASTNKVEIYTAPWCGACKKAKQWLREKNIPFQEYDIQNDGNAALRMKKLGGDSAIPFAIINGNTIEGFSAYRYSSALH